MIIEDDNKVITMFCNRCHNEQEQQQQQESTIWGKQASIKETNHTNNSLNK
jgi:hypothetical protein